VTVPPQVTVPAGGVSSFTVQVTIDPAKLAEWPFTHSAGFTGEGTALNGPEFDGLIKAVATDETLHLGWTVLPERSADVSTRARPRPARRSRSTNASTVLDGAAQVFGLTGTSPKMPKPARAPPARRARTRRDRPAGSRRP
jgi:hypothetical protein